MSGPTAGEQKAFSDASDLVKRLTDRDGISGAEIGRGLLIAAVNSLRKSIGNQDTAELLYTFADDYAVRDTSKKEAD